MFKQGKIFVMFSIILVLLQTKEVLSQVIYISNCAQLQGIESNLSGTYYLSNDVDCSSIVNFHPIGNNTRRFVGVFDGQNYTIKSLYINYPFCYNIGIFGVTQNATIRNVNLYNMTVITTNYHNIGAMVGIMLNTSIMQNVHLLGNSSASNLVSSNSSYVGGLAGAADHSTICDCTVSYTLVQSTGIGSYSIGGIVGILQYTSVMFNCHNFGFSNNSNAIVAIGSCEIGGLVGYVYQASMWKSGIFQGTVCGNAPNNGNGNFVGGVAGIIREPPVPVYQLYAHSSVNVNNM